MIFFILCSSKSLAKFFSNIMIESDNEVEEPIVLIEKDKTIDINSIENKTYNFKVKNYNEEKVSGVDIEYYVKIFVENDILIKLYKNNQEIKLLNNETEKYLLCNNSKQEDNYKIEILFLENFEKEILDEIKMKVYFEQK